MKTTTSLRAGKILSMLLVIFFLEGYAQENKVFHFDKVYSSDQKSKSPVYAAVTKHLAQFRIYKINTEDIYSYVQSAGPDKQFSIERDGEMISFHLILSDLFTPDYTLRVITDKGIREHPVPALSAYKGFVNGKPENTARVSIREDYFLGVYRMDTVEYCIQPLSAFTEEGNNDEYVFYQSAHRLETGRAACDYEPDKKVDSTATNNSNDLIEEKRSNPLHKKDKSDERTQAAWYCSELAYLADYPFYVKAGSSVPNTTNRLTDIFNLVQALYDNVQVSHKISEIVVDATNSLTITSGTAIDPIQSAFTSWGNTAGNFKNKFDIAVLYTSVDIVSPTVGAGLIGRSTIGGACTGNKYNIVEYWTAWANDYTKHRVCMAHEMGHNYNAVHVSGCSTCILTPSLSGTETQWGSVSTSITNFVTGKSPACLTAGQCVTSVGITEISKEGGLLIYPNPSQGVFTISFPATKSRNVKIVVSNVLGEEILMKEMEFSPGRSTSVDLSNEAQGMYMIRVTGSDFQWAGPLIFQ